MRVSEGGEVSQGGTHALVPVVRRVVVVEWDALVRGRVLGLSSDSFGFVGSQIQNDWSGLHHEGSLPSSASGKRRAVRASTARVTRGSTSSSPARRRTSGANTSRGRVVELDTRAPQDLEHVGVVVGARQGHAVLLQLLFVPGRGAGGGRGRRRERRGRLRRRIHAACGARGRSRPWSTGETEGRCIARGGHRERAARARVCRLGPAKKTHKIIKSFLVGTKNGYKESNPALLFLSSHVHRGVVERAAHRGFMMPAVYPDRLTTRAVPQPRAGVRRSSDQIRGIDTEDAIPANKTRRQPLIAHTVTIIKLNLPHPPLVPLERPLQLEPVEVPQLHRLIGTRRGQQSAIRR